MSSGDSSWEWDDLVLALRALGGAADNVVLGNGKFGRGLFPLDRSKPFRLHVPERILFPADDIEFDDEGIRIKDSASFGVPEGYFFENYQQSFSWGRVGHTECAAFIDAMDALPSDVREALFAEFGFGLEGDRAARIGKWFLQSRVIDWNGKSVVMPLIELANHSDQGIPYEFGDGIEISGKVEDEILVFYGRLDAFRSFQAYGFAKPSHAAFSFPMKLTRDSFDLMIGSALNEFAQKGTLEVPHLRRKGKSVFLSHLMIGNSQLPRMSRGIFRSYMETCGISQAVADDVFDLVVHQNRKRLHRLLALVESCEGEMAVTLRKMARYQLEAMSYCIGSRDPNEPAQALPATVT